MRKALGFAAASVLCTIGLGAFATGATAAGAQKVPLLHPHDQTHCDIVGLPSGTSSFAIINKNGAGDVNAQVAMKDASPNAIYSAWITTTCEFSPTGPTTIISSPLVTLTTNSQGNGNVHISFYQPTATEAYVVVLGPDGEWGTLPVGF